LFKIIEIKMCSQSDEEFTYKFESGINYFKGGNSTGKTEFYKFIDFIFGSSDDISKKEWYKESLKKAVMIFEYQNIKYRCIRTLDKEINYFDYESEAINERNNITLAVYKDKLNKLFSTDEMLKKLKQFTNENLTFRTFTMFNFLGEKRQGLTYNFLDKCSDIKYYSKLNSVLNYIFNNNVEEIFELQKKIETLEAEVKNLKETSAKYDFINKQVNNNLRKLSSPKVYNGKNSNDILDYIIDYKQLNADKKIKKSKNIADLEFIYNELDEQIKIYENRKNDSKQILREYENKKMLLNTLNELLTDNKNFTYLVEPLTELLEEMDESISFSKYLIKDNTIQELKNQREILKEQIKDNNNKFQIFTIDDKNKFIILIEEYLSDNVKDVSDELEIKRKELKELKDKLKNLQNKDDTKKIDQFSNYITKLYKSAYEVSEIVGTDIDEKGFKIQYIKRGNVLQPKKNEYIKGKSVEVNYLMGSMARHTLIQLCGYLAFIKLLISEKRTPLIPILVFDHISKPFDKENISSIGKIISSFYEDISKEDVQMFIFDDKEFKDLGVEVDFSVDLKNTKKTGFNPFYVEKENNE